MDGADPDPWSVVATEWSELWGDLVRPVWQIVATAAGVGPGSRFSTSAAEQVSSCRRCAASVPLPRASTRPPA